MQRKISPTGKSFEIFNLSRLAGIIRRLNNAYVRAIEYAPALSRVLP